MKKSMGIGLILFLICGFMVFAAGSSDKERIQITYSFWGTPDEAKEVQTVADRFNRQQDRIQVTVRQIPRDTYEATLTTMAVSGTMPDCGILAEGVILQFANDGLLADVSGMYGANESKPLDSLAFRSPDKKIVAYSVANEILLLYYNRGMFDKAGIAYPPASANNAWTWDQFVDAARRLTVDSAGRNPGQAGFDRSRIVQYGAMVDTLNWQLEVWVLSNGGGFYSPDGKEVWLNRNETIEAIQRVADLHLVHNVAPLSPGLSDDGIQRSIIAGNVAMATGGQWNVGTALHTWRESSPNNDYGVAVLPYMKEKVTINTGGANVVFAQSRNKAAAMEFLKWYAMEENSWGLIESGIWMPVLSKFYTNEADTRKWVNNPAFPPYAEYKSAVVDYAVRYARPTAWYYTPNTASVNNILSSILGPVWTGQQTARAAITNNLTALRNAHAGR
ncbi:MAG: sugar ABC transporter substrate-binding protein [Treponema sp.]|nr:sugar ABC transporter substrate-binding protein [Treponema sp.]MCL2271767.1 sugar ABC transporter substrate-binding protein [Treponema sp.]